MKRITNVSYPGDCFTIPNSMTIPRGQTSVVLNEAILKLPEVVAAIKEGQLKVEED